MAVWVRLYGEQYRLLSREDLPDQVPTCCWGSEPKGGLTPRPAPAHCLQWQHAGIVLIVSLRELGAKVTHSNGGKTRSKT